MDNIKEFDGQLRKELYKGGKAFPIPKSYNGKTITSVGDEAFRYCTELKIIEIPNSVTRIGDRAFYDCRGLTSIEIPNSVTSIGECVCYNECGQCVEIVYKTSVPMRKMLSYEYCHSGPKLVEVFPYLCEFMNWKELGCMTRVSKWFYSDILVRCRLFVLAKANAAQKTIVITDENANSNNEDYKEIRMRLVIQGKEQICGKDEVEVYSNIRDSNAITSISFPRCYQDNPYVVIPSILDQRYF